MTDEELVRDALNGDQDAYALLFKRMQPRAKQVGWKFFKDSAAAEDLETDALSHLFMRLHKFDGKSKFSTWATRVFINRGLEHVRNGKKQRERTSSYDDSIDGDDGGETFASSIADTRDAYARIEAREDVKKVLELMNTRQRKILVASQMYGVSAVELADMYGVTMLSAKSMIHRSKNEARRIMADLENGGVGGFSVDSHDGFDVSPVRDRIVDESKYFAEKTCVCGCGGKFIPNGPRQIFIMGHRVPPAGAVKLNKDGSPRKKIGRKVSLRPQAQQTPRPVQDKTPSVVEEVEMVSLRIPATSLDRLLQMLPTPMKAEAVTQILTNL